MNPITHGLIGWTLASSIKVTPRERAMVTLAGLVPDVDGLGLVVDMINKMMGKTTDYWGEYHHILGHNLGLALLCTGGALIAAKHRVKTALLVFVSFHLHLLADVVGARGPDGFQWPIPYFYPFSDTVQLTWEGQWPLNGWPNILITVLLLAWMFYCAWRKGLSPLGLVSNRAEQQLIATLRGRFGEPSSMGRHKGND